MGKLYERLTEYGKSNMYPFHMPGHKRRDQYASDSGVYQELQRLDITEIPGFDNLHHPEEILCELKSRICKLYGCEQAWVSLNGSTGGLLMAISAVTKQGDTVLIARNSHQAVYHAAQIMDLRVKYIYPEMDSSYEIPLEIRPEEVEKAFAMDASIRAVVITSPTYEGVCSDVARIAEIVHDHGAKLVVDAAHGAHFGFHNALPENALALGADIVVMSIHKTLPAVTQTAIVCTNSDLKMQRKLQEYYDIYMSSSPSYLLMCSVEHCLDVLEQEGQQLFEQYIKRLVQLRNNCRDLTKICLWEPGTKFSREDGWSNLTGKLEQIMSSDEFERSNPSDAFGQSENACGLGLGKSSGENSQNYDYGKLVISADACGITGPQLADILRERYQLEVEMASLHYVIAMTSICDTEEGFQRLECALREIEAEANYSVETDSSESDGAEIDGANRVAQIEVEQRMTLREASECETELCELMKAVGRISGGFVYAYPPGIPILAPGELITGTICQELLQKQGAGVNIGGMDGGSSYSLRVVANLQEESR